MNFNGLFQFWIAQREKRLGLQISCKNGKPDSGQRQNRGNVHQTRNGTGGKLRAREPKKIHETHEDQPHRDFGKQLGTALDVARKKKKERHEKMEDQDEHRDDAPASVKPGAIETDFLGQVARPDDQELRKSEISPEHDESEQKLAEVVQVAAL